MTEQERKHCGSSIDFWAAVQALADLAPDTGSADIAVPAHLLRALKSWPADRIGAGDWFWRIDDPDDAGDSIHEALRHLPTWTVCRVHASFSAPSFYAATVPTLAPDDDETEEIIAETQHECLRLVAERMAAIEHAKGDAE